MSASRKVLADIVGIDNPEDVRCENCAGYKPETIPKCTFWSQRTKKDSFCSFFRLREEEEEEVE